MTTKYIGPIKEHNFSTPQRYTDPETGTEIWLSYESLYFKDIQVTFGWSWIPEGYNHIPKEIKIHDFQICGEKKPNDLVFVRKRSVEIKFKFCSDHQNFSVLASDRYIKIVHESSFALNGDDSWKTEEVPLIESEKQPTETAPL